MLHLETSRSFVDTVGLEWTVREISGPYMSATLARLLPYDRRSNGWLLFESAEGEKRRLSPYPPDWRTTSEFEIAHWCMRARRVPPAPTRRADD